MIYERSLLSFQLHHTYPVLEPFYFSFEKKYDPSPILEMMKDSNYSVPFITVALYLAFCYFGQKIMATRNPLRMMPSLAFWNLFLSLFSTYGTIRTVPHLLNRILTLPFERTICEAPHTAFGAGTCGLAVQLFIISKIPELFDTIFIVLRKKPLIFLHWYHHVTVLLYCWNSYVTESAAGDKNNYDSIVFTYNWLK